MTVRHISFFALCSVVLTSSASAQPGTDIYIAPLVGHGDSLAVGSPVQATNRPGYDNQPAFTPDGHLLYTSIGGDQSDVRRLNETGDRRVFHTPESEYSPAVSLDGWITVVRVEADSSQRLWGYDVESNAFSLVIPDLEPVGYYAWANPTQVALFILGEPHYLVLHQLGGETQTVARDIGRCLARIPGEDAVSFLLRDPASGWWIHRLDVDGAVSPIAPAVPESEDYAWTPAGDLLMATGNTLYRWSASAGPGWVTVAEFEELNTITRLAVSPLGDRLALVINEPPS